MFKNVWCCHIIYYMYFDKCTWVSLILRTIFGKPVFFSPRCRYFYLVKKSGMMSHVRQNQRGCVGNSGGRCLSQGLLRFPAAASWDSSGLPVIISHNGTISRTPAISPCNQIYLSPKAEALLITQNLFPVFAVKQLPAERNCVFCQVSQISKVTNKRRPFRRRPWASTTLLGKAGAVHSMTKARIPPVKQSGKEGGWASMN